MTVKKTSGTGTEKRKGFLLLNYNVYDFGSPWRVIGFLHFFIRWG